MDHCKNYSIRSAKKFSQLHFLKKTIQILLSVCLFSLLFSQTSLLAAMLNYLDLYMPSFSIKLFQYNTERNYIFLLFNGILAVILTNSGLVSKSAMNSSYEDSSKEKSHHLPEVSDAEISKRKTEVTKKAINEAVEHGRTNGILVAVKSRTGFTERADAEEDERQRWILAKDGMNGFQTEEDFKDEDQEEEEQQEQELMNDDEFNRKCDEFIKKMREGIQVGVSANNHS